MFMSASSTRPSCLWGASPHQLGLLQKASLNSSGLNPEPWGGKKCHDQPVPGFSSVISQHLSPCFPSSLRVPPCLESWEKEHTNDSKWMQLRGSPESNYLSVWALLSLFPNILSLPSPWILLLEPDGFFPEPQIKHFRKRIEVPSTQGGSMPQNNRESYQKKGSKAYLHLSNF